MSWFAFFFFSFFGRWGSLRAVLPDGGKLDGITEMRRRALGGVCKSYGRPHGRCPKRKGDLCCESAAPILFHSNENLGVAWII